jgi:hypothetical protein
VQQGRRRDATCSAGETPALHLAVVHVHLEVNLSNLEINLKKLEIYLENLEVNLKNLEINLENLEINLENLEINLENLEINLKNLEINLENLEVNLKNLEINLEKLEINLQNPEINLESFSAPAKLERAVVVVRALAGGFGDARGGAAVGGDDLLEVSDFARAIGRAETGGVANADPPAGRAELLVGAGAEVLELPVQRGAAAEELVDVVAVEGAVQRRQVDLRGVSPQLAHQVARIAPRHAGDGEIERHQILELAPARHQDAVGLGGHGRGERSDRTRQHRLAETVPDELQVRANHRAFHAATDQRLAADMGNRRRHISALRE